KSTTGNDGAGQKIVISITPQFVSAQVLGFTARVEDFDELQRAIGGMIHDLRNNEACATAALPQSLGSQRPIDPRADHVSKIPKSRRRKLAGIMTGNRKAQIDGARHAHRYGPELRPVLTVETRVTCEDASNTFQAEPGVGIIDRK